MSSSRAWYLVYTKPRAEIRANENLLRQGYKTYLPTIHVEVKRQGNYIKRTDAFFPRYLFVNLDQVSDNWGPIRSTIGVTEIIRFGGLPVSVPEKVIDLLKLNEIESGSQKIKKKSLTKGDSVNIISGPFEGLHGIFQQTKSAERVSVLLDIVGINTQVSLNMNQLR